MSDDSDSVKQLVDEYMRIVFMCQQDVRRPAKSVEMFTDACERIIRSVTNDGLKQTIHTAKSRHKRWEAMMGLAMRYLVGLGSHNTCPMACANEAITEALDEDILNMPSASGKFKPPSQAMIAETHCLAAYAYYVRYVATVEDRVSCNPAKDGTYVQGYVLGDLVSATRHAYLSASQCDHLSEIVYIVFYSLRSFSQALGVDLKKYKFWRRMEPLLKTREWRLILENIEGPEYASRPACAWRDCKNNNLTRRQARRDGIHLFPCMGGCSLEGKPTYCNQSHALQDDHLKSACNEGYAIQYDPPKTVEMSESHARAFAKMLAEIDV